MDCCHLTHFKGLSITRASPNFLITALSNCVLELKRLKRPRIHNQLEVLPSLEGLLSQSPLSIVTFSRRRMEENQGPPTRFLRHATKHLILSYPWNYPQLVIG